MKKILSIMLILTLLLPCGSGVSASASSTSLTKRELAIAQAYIKAYETGKLSNVSKYVYPKSKFKINAVSSGTSIKIFSPKYTKNYDTKSKMNYITVSCIITKKDETGLTVSKGTLSINLETKDKTTYLYSQNTTKTKLTKTSLNDITSSELSSIESYFVDKYGEDASLKMLYGITKASSATLTSPAELGSTYAYSYSYMFKNDTIKLNGDFTLALNSVKDITRDEAFGMGYKGLSNEYIEYKLINMTWSSKNVKVIDGVCNNIYTYKEFMSPIFRGILLPNDNDYINIVLSSGFDNSFQSNMDELLKTNTMKSNPTANFTVTGDIVVPVVKDTLNYLRFVVRGEPDPQKDMIYFKIQ